MNRKSPEKDINPDSSLTPLQRVLVLQGGGSLGAYEAGVYKVLYEHISKQIDEDENVFDIIAGTSIGAINAALLLNHVLENRRNGKIKKESWKGSDKTLERFLERRYFYNNFC